MRRRSSSDLQSMQRSQHRSHFGAGDEKADSENVIAESVSGQPVLSEKTVVKKDQEEKMTIAKSTVANDAAEEGTSQHAEVLDHLRERTSETEFLPHHGVRAREKQEGLEQLSRVSEQ